MDIWRPTIDKKKYKQVILFLLSSSANNPLLGKVKLFKLLYYVDFDHYQSFEAPVTGDTYHKLPYGPGGDHIEALLVEMAADGLISISKRQVGNDNQYVYAGLTAETPQKICKYYEVDVIEQVAKKWACHTRDEIVTATHGEAPWIAVDMYAEIPYSLAFYRRPLSETEAIRDEELLEPVNSK